MTTYTQAHCRDCKLLTNAVEACLVRKYQYKALLKKCPREIAIVAEAKQKRAPIPESEDETVFLRSTGERIGRLTPILRDRSGEIIDGVHRLQADPSWLSLIVYDIDKREDPVKFHLARLIVNVCRRQVSAEEKTEILGEIARLSKWTPQQISEATGMSYRWVMKYLPENYKRPYPEVDKRQESAQRAELPEASIPSPASPELPASPTSPRESSEAQGFEATKEVPTPSQQSKRAPPSQQTPSTPTPKPETIDIGEFECPECHQHFLVEHVNRNLHRIKLVKTT